jgi:hypothetical protein
MHFKANFFFFHYDPPPPPRPLMQLKDQLS